VSYGLPFRIVVVDTEYLAAPGERQVPVCLCAQDLESGQTWQLWQDELDVPPFPLDKTTLIVAYAAFAEMGTFQALGWPEPPCVLDLFAEHRRVTNGRTLATDNSLLGALAFYGITAMTKEQKDEGRRLVMEGPPWYWFKRRPILDYCMADVTATAVLATRMLPEILAEPHRLGQALWRGRYAWAVAAADAQGIPIDVPALATFRENYESIRLALINMVDKEYGVYRDGSFNHILFGRWLAARGIRWPRTSSGLFEVEDTTFRDMAAAHPELENLRQLHQTTSKLKPEKLTVGADGRNRAGLYSFGALTGRNAPKASQWVYGRPAWMRSFVRPGPGRALISLDWKSQEPHIGAALSGDTQLLEDLRSDDLYLSFARRAGLAPPEATKQTHPAVRELVKTVFLASGYGMGWKLLAARANLGEFEAQELLRSWVTTYRTYTGWLEEQTRTIALQGWASTLYGWTFQVQPATKPNTLRNFPVQANAAEMMRFAAIYAVEAGIELCTLVHDSLVVEADVDDVFAVQTITTECMNEASRRVLGDLVVPVEVSVVRAPDRYVDPRGRVMWDRVQSLLSSMGGSLPGVGGSLPSIGGWVGGVGGSLGCPTSSPHLSIPTPPPQNLNSGAQIESQDQVALDGENPCTVREISLEESA
jgi:hypothetical protein